MKMMKKTLLIILLMLCCPFGLSAQTGLAVQEAFRHYAVRSDVTEVLIEGSRLKPYHLSLFHSIEIQDASHGEADHIVSLIRRDTVRCVSSEGRLSAGPAASAFFEIPGRRNLHRYIFYRCSDERVTLIYIEGRAAMAELKRFFKKSK